MSKMKILMKKNPRFRAGDHARISKYKNVFAKGYASNWSEKNFVVKKIKTQYHGLM